jgi:hypothetical protein
MEECMAATTISCILDIVRLWVVPHETLMEETDAVGQRILRCDQAAITTAMERSPQFFDKVDRGRAGATASAL